MAKPIVDERAAERMTMDYAPALLSGPTGTKTVKGPKGMKPPARRTRE